MGKQPPLQVVRKFIPKTEPEEETGSIFGKLMGKVVRKKKENSGILVKGIDDVLIKFGKCCRPVPGDAITGYITQGFGVTIHRTTCKNALKMNPERQIDVRWDNSYTETYPVKVAIRSLDRVGLLADVAANISKNGANIQNVNTKTNEDNFVDIFLTLAVENTEHLNRVLSSLKKVKYVQEVKRIDI